MPIPLSTEIKGSLVPAHLHSGDLGDFPVRLELLDEDQKSLNLVATGFIYVRGVQSFLVTCWHVVTGYDYPDPEVKEPPKRRYVRMTSKQAEVVSEGHYRIHGSEDLVIPLYDDDGRPRWHQEYEPPSCPHPDLNAINISVPCHLDAVAIPIGHDPLKHRLLGLSEGNLHLGGRVRAGDAVTLVGYPYGYSVFEDISPEPVFVTRGIAATVTRNPYTMLLDGVGAKGMSGSPVFVRQPDGVSFKLTGVYSGAINPSRQEGLEHDLYASLGSIVHASDLAHIDVLA